jgi:hypothetical protein
MLVLLSYSLSACLSAISIFFVSRQLKEQNIGVLSQDIVEFWYDFFLDENEKISHFQDSTSVKLGRNVLMYI